MYLSVKDIIKHANMATYAKGAEYFRKNKVQIIYNNDGYIESEVRGSAPGTSYLVSIEYPTEEVNYLRASCECPAFEEYNKMCKHIVATILKTQTLSESDTKRQERSDNAAVLMLNTYIQRIGDIAGEVHEGRAKLEPVLEQDDCMRLFFRIGEQRMYILQDLSLFIQRMHGHETENYGKNYTLRHTLASFCEESRPLVRFVMKRYDDNNYIYNTNNHYGYRSYYGGANDKRSMYLSPMMADEFFGLFEGSCISIRDHRKSTRSALVARANYNPGLRLERARTGALLSISDAFSLMWGDRSVYVLAGDVLYCCDEAFTEACGELLKQMESAGGELFFAEHDIGALFSAVLPKVSEHMRLIMDEAFEQYRPLPLVTKIYLDSPADGGVTARMTFTYGERTIEAFGGNRAVHARNLKGELAAEHLLVKYFGNVLQEDGTLRIDDDTDAVYRLVTEGVDELARVAELYTTDTFGRMKLRPQTGVTVGVRVDAGLLRMDFDLDGVELSELPEILNSYRAAKKYHRLRDGSFLTLEETALSGLSELAEGLDLTGAQLTEGCADLAPNRALYLDAVCKRNGEMRVARDRSFKQMLRDMAQVENADFPVPDGLRGVLRNYQKTGFRWLKTIDAYGFGGILADDMGLGKTLQILALLKSCGQEEEGKQLPSIVVCPSSLSLNWESEAQKFTPELHTAVIAGMAAEREAVISKAGAYDLLITSYDLLKRDIRLYEGLRFRFVIIDEAQYIKNQTTQNAKAVKTLNGKTRLALTGTPVENSLAELWSIFDFLMPGYLYPYNRFRKKFEEPIVKRGEKESSERLKQLVRPFLLRRLKKDVLKELPPKTETILRASMDGEQKKLYTANLVQSRKDLAGLAGLGAGQDRIMILAALTKMRQICCDPSLLYENYTGGSVKLEACMELVESCIRSGRRILLFSQFTAMLDIIGRRLQGTEFFRLDGSTPPARRLELVNAFNAGTADVFLISLKAGGTGLNLTGADVVIHYDPWWNLSAQNQATDRAHRIGQKNSVQVYKLIVKDTLEERILQMQARKAALADTVIEENSEPLERLNREELLSLFEESGLT